MQIQYKYKYNTWKEGEGKKPEWERSQGQATTQRQHK